LSKRIETIEIVYVQIGAAKAKHLISNIEIVHKVFPKIFINCVISKDSITHQSLPKYVNAIEYKPVKLIDNILKEKSVDQKFRQGFWRYTSERLIALQEAHISRPESSLLHIESDVLIFPNFPFSNFLQIKKVCWLPNSLSSDAASIMYFPNLKKSMEFNNDLKNLFIKSKQINDMELLWKLRNDHPLKYHLLPTTHTNFPNLSDPSIRNTIKSSKYFNGIFDPAPIGMWLTGIDPRNNFGITNYFSTKKITSFCTTLRPSAYPLYFVNEKELFFKNSFNSLPVYNLHIHSKSRKIFSTKWYEEIHRLAKLSISNIPYSEFSFTILVSLVVTNFLKGTLAEYLYNSPLIRKLMRNGSLQKIAKRSNVS